MNASPAKVSISASSWSVPGLSRLPGKSTGMSTPSFGTIASSATITTGTTTARTCRARHAGAAAVSPPGRASRTIASSRTTERSPIPAEA